MKKLILIITVCFFSTITNAQIKAVTMDEVLKMADTTNGPVIVNFFATWCSPCVHELPYFEKLVAASDKKVKMILVSLDFPQDYPKGIQAFMKKNNYVSTVVWLRETNADLYCPKVDKNWNGVIPVTLMINKAKNYRQFFGTQLTEPRFELELKKLLD
jgi:thiol-disulfide isomerase/thioredoxin